MSVLASHPRAVVVLRVVFTTLVATAYLPLVVTAVALAPEIVQRAGPGYDLSVLAAYTLISCCLPFVLGLMLAFARSRFAVSPRIRRVLTLVVIVNWFPLCVVNLGWVIVTCRNCWMG